MGRYQLRARAVRMDETRRRIVEAALKLHTTIGPANTSIVAVADAAGVQRHTVYSHFPDDKSLFAACGGLFYERNPYPPMEPWRVISDPGARLHRALTDMYRYFRAHERELWPIVRDAPLLPHLTGRRLAQRRAEVLAAISDGWSTRGAKARRARALLDVALRFETWRALTGDGGLTDRDAAATMADAVLCADGKG
jgi:AcrR family transcriptional regulator